MSDAKAHEDARARKPLHDTHERRVQQYAALFELRRIKNEGVDDSQYIHSLSYADLDNEQFKNISHADAVQLRRITAALKRIANQQSVSDRSMRSTLTAEQYADYVASFDSDMSHIESDEHDDVPWQLSEYMDKVREGDKYTRIANMFKRSTKRDFNGRTAFGRYEAKAESCYEDAVMLLTNAIDTDPRRNPNPDAQLTGAILRCLDRDVNPEPGYGPDISAAGVPRVRGTNSKYTLISSEPIVGVRLRRHWRQREALSKAALKMLYVEQQVDVLTDQQLQRKMRRSLDQMLKYLHPERD